MALKLLKTIILCITIFKFNFSFAQSKKELAELLTPYKSGYFKPIPDTIAQSYFDYSLERSQSASYSKLHSHYIMFTKPNAIGLSASFEEDTDCLNKQTDVVVIDSLGKSIQLLHNFNFEYSDCCHKERKETVFHSDSILMVVYKKEIDLTEYITECIKDTAVHIKVEYYNIAKNGFISFENSYEIDTRRKHYSASISEIIEQNITLYDIKELVEIRQEILASHGHYFTDDYWRTYFETKLWYNPRDYSNTLLNPIEKKNIALIEKYLEEVNED